MYFPFHSRRLYFYCNVIAITTEAGCIKGFSAIRFYETQHAIVSELQAKTIAIKHPNILPCTLASTQVQNLCRRILWRYLPLRSSWSRRRIFGQGCTLVYIPSKTVAKSQGNLWGGMLVIKCLIRGIIKVVIALALLWLPAALALLEMFAI